MKKIEELQIEEDISEAFHIFDLNDLDTEKEITEGVEQISELGQKYRHVHVELKSEMGETEHAESYAEKYSSRCQSIREYIKTARLMIKNLNLVVQENCKQAHADEEDFSN